MGIRAGGGGLGFQLELGFGVCVGDQSPELRSRSLSGWGFRPESGLEVSVRFGVGDWSRVSVWAGAVDGPSLTATPTATPAVFQRQLKSSFL